MKAAKILPWLLVLALVAALFYTEAKKGFWSELLKPMPTETEVAFQAEAATVTKMVQLGKLELVKYELKDVAEFTQKNRFMVDNKILMLIAGEAAGCIDLQKINPQDVNVQGDTVLVMLPPPELCYYKLNQEDCKIYDLTLTKLFDKTQLVESAYKKAEARIEEIALQSGILEKSKENAHLVLRPILENLTQKTVILQFPLEGGLNPLK